MKLIRIHLSPPPDSYPQKSAIFSDKNSKRHTVPPIFHNYTKTSAFTTAMTWNNNFYARPKPITCLSLHKLFLTGEKKREASEALSKFEMRKMLALIKQSSEHKNHKNDSLWKIHKNSRRVFAIGKVFHLERISLWKSPRRATMFWHGNI